ncbi:stage II sporulation protein M [Erythrobacter arachoides]|uniref:Stage II sporulation protein M n=1 Tax=Aurantiacibacter arachoides TaxID=1850444 RepID=A0A844ZWJ1_9SPHN|nr:stage II sporulation protein M [Aurantiacibacter arachoides]MXO92255.1 stage II sporulation protein M [Aurantiacibacter arachoides]GGD58504.1 membrane protein [Aurantiacibacter arachoides]
MALTLFRKAEIAAPADIAAASLRSDRFRLEREVDWQRLDAIVTALEKGRPRSISDADLLDLPVLYRKTASSLAVARETSLDAAALDYLEALVRRAWFQIYGPRIGFVGWLRTFLGGGWSASVRAIWLDICIALAVSLAGVAVGWLLVARDQEWFYALVPPGMAGGRVPGASRAVLEETLAHDGGAEGLTTFAASLFSNNTGVAIMAFALGFAFGVPTLLLLVYNMALLGAMLWVFADAGLGYAFGAWLSIHGTTELLAIVLAGAAGLHVGRTMAFPGERSVLSALQSAGVRAAQVMAGCALMLVIAGLLEGYGRQLIDSAEAKYAVGGFMLAFWVLYFLALKRPREAESERAG